MSSITVAHADAHMADGDQRPHPTKADEHTGPRLQEGQANAHKANDPQDSRSINNRAQAEQIEETQQEKDDRLAREAPTSVARSHGNEPSKGAKIDEQLLREEQEELARKGKA